MAKITEDDVYKTLSYQVKKSPLEIRGELRPVGKISLGALYEYLESLVNQGFAQWQYRALSAEQLEIRRGNRKREYWLTTKGISNKPRESEAEEGLGGLVVA